MRRKRVEEAVLRGLAFFARRAGGKIRRYDTHLPQADLVYAQYSLPFADADLEASVDAAIAAVKPGGACAGQLFVHNDTWAGDGAAAVDREWIESKFSDFSELDIDEKDFEGSYGGSEANQKRWHVFHIHARRGGQTSMARRSSPMMASLSNVAAIC